MKNIIKTILIIMISAFLGACASYNITKYQNNQNIQTKLPPLKVNYAFTDAEVAKVDSLEKEARAVGYSFHRDLRPIGEKTFNAVRDPYGRSIELPPDKIVGGKDTLRLYSLAWGIPYSSTVTNHTLRSITLTKLVEQFDNRSSDAAKLIQLDFQNNICKPYQGNYAGQVNVRVTSLDNSWNLGWFVPSALTLFTINFLGVPASTQNARVTVNVDITDENTRRLASYCEEGEGTSYIAMYWGYSFFSGLCVSDTRDITRAAFSDAIADALSKINRKILADMTALRQGLENASSNK